MDIKSISREFAVAAQISADDVALAAAQGIKSIICNRPDFEAGPNQPTAADIAEAADKHGMTFRLIPFASGRQGPEEVAQFRQALAELPSPVLAYCRSGTRSSQIWAMARSLDHPVQQTLDLAAAAGIDLSKMRPLLEQIAGQGAQK